MKIIIYFFVFISFISPLKAQWIQVPSGTNENLNDIQFVDVNTGFAVGNGGVVIVTTNSGNNWSTITTGLTQNNLSIYFLNSNTGYISSNNNILFTSNSGNNWTTMFTFNSIFSSLYFLNQSTGFATSNNNYFALYKTSNGGLNWSNYPYAFCKSVKFINSTFGYCTSLYWDTYGWYDRVLTTSSSGSTWDIHNVYPSSYQHGHLNSVDFITTTVGYTVGDSGKVYKTNDGGNSWTYQNSNTYSNLKSVKSLDLNKTLTVGNNGVIKATTNGGTSWVDQISPTTNNLNSLKMVNSTTGFISGDAGTILKTTNGGAIGIKQIGEIIPQEFALLQNYPNPFNGSTIIQFSVPKSILIVINLYDINGRFISKIFENKLSAGIYGTSFDAAFLASGIYFIRLESNSSIITKKISLIK